MKRLVAIAVNTEQLGPSTQDEIKWISEKDKNLNESTWHNFEKRDNRGSWGNVYYYEGNEGQIYVYIVDSFCFLDTDKLSPNEINTFSYMLLGAFDTEQEAINFKKYMMCKFPRFLLRLTYSSMNIAKSNFMFVPKVDFKKEWTDKILK